jgi:amino acid adenylation domain-containing protein
MNDRDAGTSVPLAERYVSLSGSQRSLWFQYLKHPELQGYFSMSFVMRIEPGIDAARLRAVLDELTRRHTLLRVSFATVDGEVMQQAHAAASVPLQVLEVESDAAAIARLVEAQRHRPFDTSTAPLARATLYQAGQAFSVLLYTMDHLVSDGWSGWQIGEQIVSMLGAGCGADHAQYWQPVAPEFFEHVLHEQRWLSGAQARRQLEYWKQELARPAAVLELPCDRSQPERRAAAVAKLDTECVQRLHALASRLGVSTYVVLLAPYLVMLQRLTGQTRLAVGAPMPGRSKQWHGTFGVFTNTVVLRAELTPGMRVADLLTQLRGTLFRALKNQAYPFAELMEQLRPHREHSDQPFFQVWFNHQNARIDSQVVNLITPVDTDAQVLCGDLLLRPFGEWLGSGGPGLDLLLETVEIGTQLRADLNYNAGRFEHATIERYLGYWQHLLEAMLSNQDQELDQLPMLSEAERRQVLYDWNAKVSACPQTLCVHALFQAQARRTPAAIAVECAGEQLAYQELNTRANQLARRLLAAGVGAGDRVAVLLERSIELVVAELAVLKCGAAYVPLDVSAPLQRQRFVLEDSAAKCLLSTRTMAGRDGLGLTCIEVDDAALQALAGGDLNIAVAPQACAYVMYTSGSTGMPKGVVVPHRAVVRLAVGNDYVQLGADDGIGFAASPAFDATTFEVWGALLNGARVVVITQRVLLDPQAFGAELQRSRVSVLFLTIGLFNQMAAAQPGMFAALRYLLTGGDVLDPKRIASVLRHGPPAHFLACYGPTETTTFATTYEVTQVTPQTLSIPIGRPIANWRVYILDARGEPVPVGVRGEIHIGGAGVADGYLDQPERTRERFVKDPFVADAQQMFRTGDLGCWRADGAIEFLGRNDEQVKIRGFRIELPEIEARLREIDGIVDAVVVVRADADGDKRLLAYYVGTQLSVEALRAQLGQSLPEYMVPAAYVALDALPLNANGKLDRAALPLPGADAYARSDYEPPRGAVEELLAQLWCELLHREQVGRHDHFFALGGHSLLAVKLIDQLRQHGLQLQVRSLFLHPTLAALATEVVETDSAAVPESLIPPGCTVITPQMLPLIDLSPPEIASIVAAVPGGVANVQDIYPLSAPQEGILFHYLLEQRGDAYGLPSLLRFDSRQRLDEFVAALTAAIARHDILRTAFHWEGVSQPVQVVWRHAELSVTTLEVDPAAGSAADQLRARFAPRHHRLDVRRAPLMQVCMAHDPLAPGWLLMVASHHLIQDNTALAALLQEMQLQLRGAELPAPLPYRNFVARLRLSGQAQNHAAFFRDMLAAVDEPTLPFGLEVGGAGELQRARTVLTDALSRELHQQARALGVSVASLYHLAWARLVACAAGLEQVVFGTVLFGRMHAGAGASRAGGVFTNTLPICIAADGGAVRARVIDTHRRLAQLLHYETASLAEAQRCSALPSAISLFSSFLNYRHGIVDGQGDLGWPGVELLDSEEGSHYPLRLSIDALDGGFTLTAHAPAQVGAPRVCALMTTLLQSLVTALAQAPDTPVNRLQLLPAEELQQVLYGWNAPRARPAAALCVHELFEQQVLRTPQIVAVEHGERCISYAELNRRANQLARHLRELGVGPEQRVVLSMERSIEMVVGVLAILKAGGTYVPLEPSYPAARLQYILQDAAPCLLLTQRALREVLPASSVPVFEVDAAWDCVAAFDTSNLPGDPRLTPSLMASITYTSGSTGHPKGVMADHARAVNRALDQVAVAPLEVGEKCAHKTAIGFVDSIFETLHPLLAGATLVIIPNSITVQLRQLAATLAAHRVTRWITVPSLASALLLDEQCVQQLQGLRHWLLSGEALPPAVLFELRQQLPRCAFINIYGSSEAADATYYVAGMLADESRVPIGRPLANTQVYVLDVQGAPVPVGVPGEIYVGGACLARGYLNLPELTAQRFLDNPFSNEPGARMYRTGDLGRWRSDGLIDYLGRNDQQVKIRGFRIELGEIEVCLRGHPLLSDVVVAARCVTTQDKHLVAYYISAEEVGAESLRNHVTATLPHYMVPTAYVRLRSFPLSPNGKLERRALPAPDGNSYVRAAVYDAPLGEVETRLAQLWMELLKVERVGRRDHFFELGGHSLLAVSLAQLIRAQFEVDVSIAEVFGHPELAQLAERVTEAMLEQFDAEELSELGELLQ